MRRRRDEAGAIALLVGLMSVVLFTISGLVIDLGQARVSRREAQNAADSAALAAGNALYLSGTATPDITGAVAAARSYAANVFGTTDAQWTECSDTTPLAYRPDPATSCISFDSATAPLQVRVVVPRQRITTPFGGLIGVDHVDVGALAETTLTPGGKASCGLCIIGEGYHDLQNGNATISGGDVAINGSVNIQNNGLVATDGSITVEGNASGPLSGYDPDPITHQQPIVDPLATIPLPDYSALTLKSNPCTDGPGIYGGYNFPPDCVLTAGLYVVTGQWSFSGQASLDAHAGVTLYFVCGSTTAPRACNAPGEQGGWLDATGQGAMVITAPTAGPTAGLAVVYDRLDTQLLRLTGNSGTSYQGTIYAAAGTLDYRGNGCGMTYDALIDVGNMSFSGNNACLDSTYSQARNVYVPPSALHLSR